MKIPHISADVTNSNLAGAGENVSWVRGHNCVYEDGGTVTYRVSIRTPRGWKLYGRFNNLETARYVANIAILAEHCEEQYELNEGIGQKDDVELNAWRRIPGNIDAERYASAKFREIQIKLEEAREQRRIEAEQERIEKQKRMASRAAAREEEYQNRIAMEEARRRLEREKKISEITSYSGPELVRFLKTTNTYDPYYDVALTEARRRLRLIKKLGAT